MARIRRLREPLGERAPVAGRRARRPGRHRACQFARAAGHVLGVRETRRGRRSAVAAADRVGTRVAARRRAAEGRAGLDRPARDAGRSAAAAAVHAGMGADRRRRRRRGRRLSRVRIAAPGSERRGARRERGCGRSADADVHLRDHGLAEGHSAHAFHSRDVCDDHGQCVADGAGIGRPALGRDRVQRCDGDHVPCVHAGRDLRAAAGVRRRGLHRHGRARG